METALACGRRDETGPAHPTDRKRGRRWTPGAGHRRRRRQEGTPAAGGRTRRRSAMQQLHETSMRRDSTRALPPVRRRADRQPLLRVRVFLFANGFRRRAVAKPPPPAASPPVARDSAVLSGRGAARGPGQRQEAHPQAGEGARRGDLVAQSGAEQ